MFRNRQRLIARSAAVLHVAAMAIDLAVYHALVTRARYEAVSSSE